MKIARVEAIILESPQDYGVHGGEAAGPRFRSLLRVSTDEGIDGWAEIETQPHVLKAVIDAPGDGSGMFEGLGRLLVGEDPFKIEELWHRLYTGTIYYGRRGVVLQAISGIDLACHDIMGKALGKPIHALLGGAKRDRVTAYASTLQGREVRLGRIRQGRREGRRARPRRARGARKGTRPARGRGMDDSPHRPADD